MQLVKYWDSQYVHSCLGQWFTKQWRKDKYDSLKPGKDPEQPVSYRPISLLTTDLKLLTKVITMRLSKVIAKIIHQDPSGFIPNRSMANDLHRVYLNMHIPTDNQRHRAILSLDAAKAFNSVEWQYLWQVLEKFNLGRTFISWITLFYKKYLLPLNCTEAWDRHAL